MTLVEKIAGILKQDRYEADWIDDTAKEILQAILSDSSIFEVDTEAELPLCNLFHEGSSRGYNMLKMRRECPLIKAGWVKPKE